MMLLAPSPSICSWALRLIPSPMAKQPNHAGHADEDAQHRQQRPQGVQEQALDAQLPGAKPEEEHGIEA